MQTWRKTSADGNQNNINMEDIQADKERLKKVEDRLDNFQSAARYHNTTYDENLPLAETGALGRTSVLELIELQVSEQNE